MPFQRCIGRTPRTPPVDVSGKGNGRGHLCKIEAEVPAIGDQLWQGLLPESGVWEAVHAGESILLPGVIAAYPSPRGYPLVQQDSAAKVNYNDPEIRADKWPPPARPRVGTRNRLVQRTRRQVAPSDVDETRVIWLAVKGYPPAPASLLACSAGLCPVIVEQTMVTVSLKKPSLQRSPLLNSSFRPSFPVEQYESPSRPAPERTIRQRLRRRNVITAV